MQLESFLVLLVIKLQVEVFRVNLLVYLISVLAAVHYELIPILACFYDKIVNFCNDLITSSQYLMNFVYFIIVYIGASPPPPLSCQAPLKSTNCPSSSPFLVNLPLYIGFSWTLPPPQSRIFQWNHKILKFCILSTILYFNGKAGIKIVQKKFNPLMHNVPKWSDTL